MNETQTGQEAYKIKSFSRQKGRRKKYIKIKEQLKPKK